MSGSLHVTTVWSQEMDERVEEAVKIKQQAMLKERKKLLASDQVHACCCVIG